MKELKDSGIPWVGKMPNNWALLRGKNILSLLERPVKEDDGVITCFRNGEVTLRSKRREDGFTFSLQEFGYQGIEPGDLVVHGMDGFAGAIGISDSRGKATPVLNVLNSTQNKRYMMYQMRTMAYCGLFYSLSSGIRVRSCDTNWNKLKTITYLVPPLFEQKRITSIIDSECAEIDAILNNTKASIGEYKKMKQSVIIEAVTKGIRGERQMKSSGEKWIDIIPVEWTILRGKTIMTLLERPVKEDDGVVTCFRDGEVTLRSNRREEGFTFSLEEAGYQGIEPGDLVVHGMDGFAGSIGVSDSRGKATPVLVVLDSQENKHFLMYQMRAMAYCGLFLSLSTGIRVRSCDTNWNKLKTIRYFIPQREEQDEIVSYLDRSLRAIDSLIASKEALISELENYKKSLIYEYVTGKKEVI